MSATVLDAAAVRAHFSALDRPTAFLDGPGGTQTPEDRKSTRLNSSHT